MRRDYRAENEFMRSALNEGIWILQKYRMDDISQMQLEYAIHFFESKLREAEKLFTPLPKTPAWKLEPRYQSLKKFPFDSLSFRSRLYILRKEKQLSMKEAAQKLGTSLYRYRKYESGEAVPNLEERKEMAAVFGVEEERLKVEN